MGDEPDDGGDDTLNDFDWSEGIAGEAEYEAGAWLRQCLGDLAEGNALVVGEPVDLQHITQTHIDRASEGIDPAVGR